LNNAGKITTLTFQNFTSEVTISLRAGLRAQTTIKGLHMWQALNELHPTTRRLLAARAVRSVAQGALVADLSLYLHALHCTGVAWKLA